MDPMLEEEDNNCNVLLQLCSPVLVAKDAEESAVIFCCGNNSNDLEQNKPKKRRVERYAFSSGPAGFHRSPEIQIRNVLSNNDQLLGRVPQCGDCAEVQTFSQLLHIKNSVCKSLRTSTRNSIIGVCLGPCVDLPAVFLGILSARCCFFFLSPNESKEYLRHCCDHLKINVVITSRRVIKMIWEFAETCQITQDIILGRLPTDCSPSEGLLSTDTPLLAYVMRTSGTTGAPKFVRVPHCCIAPNIQDLRIRFDMSTDDIIFLASPLTFDPSMVEIFLALFSGCRLLITNDETKRTPYELAQLLFIHHRVTFLQITPSLFKQFPEEVMKSLLFSENSSLRILAFGGEEFPDLENLRDLIHPNNKTRVFNLYGTTEVSCWAFCYEVTDLLHCCALSDSKRKEVGLGKFLEGTEWKLRDAKECNFLLNEPETVGELFIGGRKRRCLLDGETWKCVPGLRPTGDIVKIIDTQVVMLGRKDDMQIKRHGQRVSLKQIQMVAKDSFGAACECHAVYDSNCGTIYLAVVSRSLAEVEQKMINIRETLNEKLPAYSHPDWIGFISGLPVTVHGKMDKDRLISSVKEFVLEKIDRTDLTNCVVSVLQELLPGLVHFSSRNICSRALRHLGMDSHKAFVFVSYLENLWNIKLPGAFDIVLGDQTVDQLCSFLQLSVGNLQIGKNLQNRNDLSRSDDTFVSNANLETNGNGESSGPKILNHYQLKFLWSWDSGKCIDSRPVIWSEESSAAGTLVYVGSNSGNFAALNLVDGKERWRIKIGRIVSSCCISYVDKLVVVGCYDAHIYFVRRENGFIDWKFETGDIVKCDPVPHPSEPIVFVGSHDRHFYCLNYRKKSCVWRCEVGKAIVSGPCFAEKMGRAFVASLGATVFAIDFMSGSVCWKLRLKMPIFGSLSLAILAESDRSILVVPCVDFCIYGLDGGDGSELFKFCTNGPVFGGVSVVPIETKNTCRLLFGSNDGNTYCCLLKITASHSSAAAEISLLWKQKLESEVTASPVVFEKGTSINYVTLLVVKIVDM